MLYHLYGLAVESDFICPELTAITPEQAKTRGYQTVRVVRVHEPLELPGGQRLASWMRVTRDACLYQIDGVARILVTRPDEIAVEMLPGAIESDMRAYLFGTGFGTLVHMCGLIPLHISAIKSPNGVLAFTGPSGAGKSTKVAELHFKYGWPIICDDVAVLHPSDELPLLHAGVNRIKLWKDAVQRFGIDPSRLTRDIMREDKFHLHAPEMFETFPKEMSYLIDIGTSEGGNRFSSSIEGFRLCMNAVYRPELVELFSDRTTLFSRISLIANSLTFVTEYQRSNTLNWLEDRQGG